MLWQLCAILDDYGLTLSEVAEYNIAKLNDREKRGVIDGSGNDR